MKNKTKFVSNLLLEAKDSSEALANLNRWQKSLANRWSMQFVCKKVGIPSTGYFSDVLKGKRTLHPKYVAKTIKVFGLNEAQGRYYRLLNLRDQETDPVVLLDLEDELLKARDQIGTEFLTVPDQLASDLLFHIIVMSSISLFPEPPTREELEGYFGRALVIPLQKSLRRLEELKILKLEDSRYSLSHSHVLFNESADGYSHFDYLERSLQHVKTQVRNWFPRGEEAIFLSTLITVNREEYMRKVPEIRARIFAIMNELNTPTGDQLVEFHTQIFPFDPKLFRT